MARRRGADSEVTWDSLVEAARDALRSEGVDGFSLRRVASMAGQRLGTLQYYFPRKEELLETVLGDGYQALFQLIEQGERRLVDGELLTEVAPDLIVALFRLARRHPQLCRARMASNLLAGRMSVSSVENVHRAERRIARARGTQLDAARLRMAIHALSVLVLRYASQPPEELAELLGATSPGDAEELVEAHLRELAGALAASLERG